MLAVIVLNYMDYQTTVEYVRRITLYESIQKIIIVDNDSPNESYEYLSNLRTNKIDVIKTDHNGGYGYGNNVGIRYAVKKYNCNYICISNPDVEIAENSIIKCEKFLQNNKEYVAVAPMMLNSDGSKNFKCAWKIPTRQQYLLFSLPILGRFFQGMYFKDDDFSNSDRYLRVGCIAGSFVMVKANEMLLYGMYDENVFLYCEETVLGKKFSNAGLSSAVLSDCYFIHHHSVSINKSIKSKTQQRLITWRSRLYVLKKYFNGNAFNNAIAYLVSRIELFEYVCLNSLKNHFC